MHFYVVKVTLGQVLYIPPCFIVASKATSQKCYGFRSVHLSKFAAKSTTAEDLDFMVQWPSLRDSEVVEEQQMCLCCTHLLNACSK